VVYGALVGVGEAGGDVALDASAGDDLAFSV